MKLWRSFIMRNLNQMTFKDGTESARLALGGALILAAVARTALLMKLPLVITSGTDGLHSGPMDPHHLGQAFDVRSQGLPDKKAVLQAIMGELADLEAQLVGPRALDAGFGGYVTAHFFGTLEGEGTDNEHFHFQVRRARPLPQKGKLPYVALA